jgi:hypothetical protein
MGTRAGLDSNSDPSVVQSVASLYTNYGTTAHARTCGHAVVLLYLMSVQLYKGRERSKLGKQIT